jgi:hypothetical protein
MKTTILATIAALGLSGAASAAVAPLGLPAGFGDAEFNTACARGGASNRACETAVVELRGGDGAGRGQTELKIEDIAQGSGAVTAVTETNFGYASGTPFEFELLFDAAADLLSFGIDGGPSISQAEDLAGASSVFIRLRDGRFGALALSNLLVNDTLALPDLAGEGVSYLALGGFDADVDFKLTGTGQFDLDGSRSNVGSNLAAQVKFTDLDVAPIPLPAAGWLLLAGVGGLGAMGARRRAA